MGGEVSCPSQLVSYEKGGNHEEIKDLWDRHAHHCCFVYSIRFTASGRQLSVEQFQNVRPVCFVFGGHSPVADIAVQKERIDQ